MRSTFKVLFYVNGGKEKEGKVSVMGRVTVNGQVAQFSCKQTITIGLWNAKGNRAKGKGDEAQRVNHDLDKIKARIIELYNQIRERENFVTAEMVRNAYQGIGNEYETLLRAFDKFIADFRKRVGKEACTLQKHCCVLKHVADFIASHYRRKDIAMKELTEDFIRQFEIHLRNELGLMGTTIWLYIAPLKMIVTRAHCDGHLHRNPFARHSFTCLALNMGMPIESVSKILGHTNITTTQIYVKITAEKLEHDMSAFGAKLEAGLARAKVIPSAS